MNWQNIKNQIIVFLENEVNKTGFKKVIVGLSGGLDSAIVAVLCEEVFKDNFQAILMPSYLSSGSSTKDAIELCNKFNMSYEIIDITPMIKGYFDNLKDKATSLRIGNFSARMRMSVLYDISAKNNALVIGTSNKSEILLGYGTLYGDTACAINPIGQMYKSDEFEFAKFLGVTTTIIKKKPSADLWEGQSDEEELGYSYKTMDNVLKQLVDEQKSKNELIKNGVDEELINMLEYRIKANAFKSKLPIIADIKF